MKLYLPLALFALLWVDLVRQLSSQWEAREQYAYGWFVPFLALALFWKRWITRPAVGDDRTTDHRTTGPVVSSPSSVVRPPLSVVRSPVVLTFVVLLALCLLPIRVVYEINPDWPLPAWLMTLVVIALTLYAFHLAGPQPVVRSPWSVVRGPWSVVRGPWSVVRGPWSVLSPWVRHFAFPVCFILVAVTWPHRIEHGLTQGLMRVVAGLTVEILGWINIPAFQRGNLIEVSTGVVGIDEACSGIRSFQSTLMAALFLGELYRLKWHRRLLLLVGGVAVSFCLNVVRTLILTWQASTAGLSALEKWHDPAGIMIFLVSFACLWAIAGWLKAKWDHGLLTTDCGQLTTDYGPPVLRSGTAEDGRTPDHGPVVPLSRSPVVPPPARRYLIAMGCWSLCTVGITELWYCAHETKDPGVFHWSARFPANNPTFKQIELAERTRSLIAHDSGGGGSWSDDNGLHWTAYFFRWNPTSIESVLRARIHRPERCLPASGLRQIADGGLENFEAAGLKLPFRQYTYEAEGKTLHVFFCQWEDGSEKQSGMWGSKLADRIRSVLVGRRKLGQQTMEVILTGPATLEESAAAFRKELPGLIQIETPRASAPYFAPERNAS